MNAIFAKSTLDVKALLKPITELSDDDLRDLLGRYAAAIEGNFIPWMSAAILKARSLRAEYAAKQNLYDEIMENHQGMLRDFVKKANSEPDGTHYTSVEKAVSDMRQFISQGNSLQILTVMATLENTSAVFIPYLASIAKKLGSTDFLYTDVHGEADILHADEFIKAVSAEAHHYVHPDKIIRQSIAQTHVFLQAIFT